MSSLNTFEYISFLSQLDDFYFQRHTIEEIFFFKNVALGVDSPLLIFFYCDVTKNGVRSKQSRPKQILL